MIAQDLSELRVLVEKRRVTVNAEFPPFGRARRSDLIAHLL